MIAKQRQPSSDSNTDDVPPDIHAYEIRVQTHTGDVGQRAGYEEPYRCTSCNAHIWELATPAEASRSDEQTGLEEFADE